MAVEAGGDVMVTGVGAKRCFEPVHKKVFEGKGFLVHFKVKLGPLFEGKRLENGLVR